VVDRIVDLVLTNGTVEDPWEKSQEIGEVLASFGVKAVSDSVLDRLRRLRDRPEIAVVTRIECAASWAISPIRRRPPDGWRASRPASI
jgi:hypothetical protein